LKAEAAMKTAAAKIRRAVLGGIVSALACSGAAAQSSASCPPQAQQPTAEQIQLSSRDAHDHGFLWRISKGGRDSYLYGTVHVAKLDWAFPGPLTQKALRGSDTVALEIDMLDPDMQRRLVEGLRAQDSAALPEAVQQRLDRRIQAECLPDKALAGLSPELQVATLMSIIGRRDGLDPAFGIDTVLAGWGHASKKTVVSLETPELQMKTLQMPSAAETLEFVESALDELESGRAAPTLVRVAKVWADSDLAALQTYESWCECMKTAADRAAMARMLDERNPGMADSIAALHAQGKKVFAAVGSLHMVGPQGLPALMAQRGFKVERVVFQP
jgi:uncharacterized protein YbaP (TraB family)